MALTHRGQKGFAKVYVTGSSHLASFYLRDEETKFGQ